MNNKTGKKHKGLYWVMCALIVVCLCIPIVQMKFHIFKVKPLQGVIIETPKPQLTLETYTSGKFQSDCEGYLSENFGLREPLIRLYCQYAWSLYHKNFNIFFIPGKNNWIFYLPSVRDYYGVTQPGGGGVLKRKPLNLLTMRWLQCVR